MSERAVVCEDLRARIGELERDGFRLDCIYVSNALRILRCRADPAARSLSDHLPVLADLDMEE